MERYLFYYNDIVWQLPATVQLPIRFSNFTDARLGRYTNYHRIKIILLNKVFPNFPKNVRT